MRGSDLRRNSDKKLTKESRANKIHKKDTLI